MPIPKKQDKSAVINQLSFDRKYRPASLDEYLGNKPVVANILNSLAKGTLPKTLLFTGPAGTGKTSLGRLLAKEILCNNKDENGRACGKCPICIEITKNYIKLGKNTRGVVEFNMSRYTSKGDVSEVIDKARELPVPPYKYKVFLLDEVHSLQLPAQNALLKLAEEPPEYLYLIFCTTNPERLIAPLKSRTREYRIKKPTTMDIVERLRFICEKEGIQYDTNALRMIVHKANRQPRKSLTFLEQVANSGAVTVENVQTVLDAISETIYMEYFETLDKDPVDILMFIESLEDKNIEYVQFLEGLSQFMLDAINMKYGVKLEQYPETTYKRVRKILNKYSYRDFVNILNELNNAIRFINFNESFAELALKTFTLKIAHPQLLDNDMSNIQKEIEKENYKTNIQYMRKQDRIKKEAALENQNVEIEDLIDIFGEETVVVDTDNGAILTEHGEIKIEDEDSEENIGNVDLDDFLDI